MLALLIIFGFLGNYYALPLFFGADFLFGSISVLLVLYFYGLGWGLIAAVLAYSYTYVLWGHPYGFIVFFLEALFVGYFLRLGRRNLLLLDGLFWLLIGLPLNVLFLHVVMQMTAATTSFIILKQSINGIVNVLLVSLSINFLRLDRFFNRPQIRRTFSLQETLFNLLVALVLIPPLFLTIMEIREEMKGIEDGILSELQTLSNDLQSHLHFWYQSRLLLVTNLAGRAEDSPRFPSLELQKDLDLIRRVCPYFFQTMYIANAEGVTLAFSPPTNEYGESTIGLNFSDRPYFQELRTTTRPVISEVFKGRGGAFSPIVTLSAPIIRQGRFAGYTLGALDLSHIQELLKPYSNNRDIIITIIDSSSQVIASTSPERPPLHLWDLKRKGEVHPISANLFRWSPDDKNLPSMTLWRRSFFVKETPVEDNISWTLILEAPIAPQQQRLYAIYIKNLSIMAVLVALTLLLALALSRWLSRPLEQLAGVTTDLPDKIMDHRSISWPESSAAEMDSLIVNFQAMTRALEQNFQELEEHGRALGQTNEVLQNEISEREQAEKSLRDSEAKYRTLIDNASEGIILADAGGNLLEVNRKMEELLGYSKAELLHMNLRQIHPEEDLERILTSFNEVRRRGEGSLLNGWGLRKDGTKVPVDITGTRIEYAGRSLIQGIFKDLTERQKTESEHLKMSKLESLGTLAGGLAHDFNNILTAILGNITLAILDPTLDERTRERLIMSEKACQRAHDLAQRLLTFAKGGVPVKQVAAIAPLVQESATLILAGTKARSEISVPDNIWSVKVDVAQIDQVISNLLINAEQAMPEGGTIKIAAENLEVGEKPDHLPLPPGKYVKLAIIDEGT